MEAPPRAGTFALKLWELDDDELEAELQRQLDGLGSSDDDEEQEQEADGGHDGSGGGGGGGGSDAGARHAKAAASARSPAASDDGENVSSHANSPDTAAGTVPADGGAKSTLPSSASPGDGEPASAWAELMASMTADTSHWDQYANELTDLRTSIASVVPSSHNIDPTAPADVSQDTAVVEGPATTFLTAAAAGDDDDDDDDDDADDDDGSPPDAPASPASPTSLLLRGQRDRQPDVDPDEVVREIRERVASMLAEESPRGSAAAEDAGAADADATPAARPVPTPTSDGTAAAAAAAAAAHVRSEARRVMLLSAAEATDATDGAAPDGTPTTTTTVETLADEARAQMNAEEREWRQESSAHDRALMEAIELRADERAHLEREARRERERFEREQAVRDAAIRDEAAAAAREIEARAAAVEAARKEAEAARAAEAAAQQKRVDALRRELEEAEAERAAAVAEAQREERERQRELTVMRVRWATEERAAKSIQRGFAAMRHRRLERDAAERARMAACSVVVQAFWRGVRARAAARERAAARKRTRAAAARQIQRLVRGGQGRRHAAAVRAQYAGARAMQRVARGRRGRMRCAGLRRDAAKARCASRVAAWWRSAVVCRAYGEQRAAAIVLASGWRSALRRRAARRERQRRRRAAAASVLLQRVWRGSVGRAAAAKIAAAAASRQQLLAVMEMKQAMQIQDRCGGGAAWEMATYSEAEEAEEGEGEDDDDDDAADLCFARRRSPSEKGSGPVASAGTWQQEEEEEGDGEKSRGGDGAATTQRRQQQEPAQRKQKSRKARAQRVFPPTHADQTLCKQNQRRHMEARAEEWMEAHRRHKKETEGHEQCGLEQQQGVARQRQRRQAQAAADDDGEQYSPGDGSRPFAAAGQRSCDLFFHWAERATAWQAASTGDGALARVLDVADFDLALDDEDEDEEEAEDTDKIAEDPEGLKQQLLASAKRLRSLRDCGHNDDAKALLCEMKDLKARYEAAVARLAEGKTTADARAKFRAEETTTSQHGARFAFSVESVSELPLDQLASYSERGGRGVTCVVANCNQISTCTGISEACPRLRSLSLRDNRLGPTLLDIIGSVGTLEELNVEMNNVASLGDLCDGASQWRLWQEQDVDESGGGGGSSNRVYPAPLRSLLASNNTITDLSCLCGGGGNRPRPPFPSLERLSLYRNCVPLVPPRLTQQLKWLRHLDLGRNQLRSLVGIDLALCPLLRTFICYENRITALPSLGNALLKELWLNGNKLAGEVAWGETDGSAGQSSWIPSLESLHLHDNAIVSLRPGMLACCPFVRHIDLSFNAIEDPAELSRLSACPHVETLRANDNPVTEHPQYCDSILLALPRLRELDGETVTREMHNAARRRAYGSNTHLIAEWQQQGRNKATAGRGGSGENDVEGDSDDSTLVDWHEMLRAANRNTLVHGSGGGEEAEEDVAELTVAWQGFEAMCRRHRIAREEMERDHRKANAHANDVDGRDASWMARAFEHESRVRRLLLAQLAEHKEYNWRGLGHDGNTVCHGSDDKEAALRSVPGTVCHHGEDAVIRFVPRENDDEDRPHSNGSSVRSGSAGSAAARLRRSVSSAGGRRVLVTGAAAAAVLFQSVYRGYRVRVSSSFSTGRSSAHQAARRSQEQTQVQVHNDDDDDEEFAAVDVDDFLDCSPADGLNFLEMDEFDFMEQQQGRRRPEGQLHQQPQLVSAPPADAQRGGWLQEEQPLPTSNRGLTSYQVEAAAAVNVNAQQQHPLQPPQQQHPLQPPPQQHPLQQPVPGSRGSSLMQYPPSPASCASSMGVGEFSRPGTGRSRLDSADSMLGPRETPVYERRMRREVQALNAKTETVKDEWGFEDKRTAQAMMARQARFQKAKREKNRRNRLKDPEYMYKLLMRRVRETKELEERGLGHSTSLESARGGGSGGGSSGGGVRKGSRRTGSSSSSSRPPKSSRSAVQRDRARHRKTRKHVLPAWASQQTDRAGAASGGGSRGSTSSSHAGSDSGDAMFQVNNWAGDEDAEGGGAGGAGGGGLSSWGAQRQAGTVLPPIGL